VGPTSEGALAVKVQEKISGKKPKIVTDLKETKVVHGKTAVLKCEIEGGEPRAKLSWYKDAREVYEGKKYSMSYSGTTAQLEVFHAEQSDASVYRVEADNKVGRVETSGKLVVQVPPKLETDKPLEPTITVKAGGNITQPFNVYGQPVPSISWLVNGQPVENSLFSVAPEQTTLTIKGCTGRNGGKYEVIATNEVGSDSAQFNVVVSDKPSAPQNLTVIDTTKDSAGLRWDRPESDGGLDILQYHIEKRDVTKTGWLNVASVDGDRINYTVTKLFEGNEYYFRVAAENKIGVGPFAELTTPVTAQLSYGPPGAPKSVAVEDVTPKSCTIKWKAPDSDGGSPITGYTVEMQMGTSTRWTKVNKSPVSKCQLDIKDLIEFNEYVFRVTAENEAGPGKPSAATGTIVAKDPFSKPGQAGKPGISDVKKDSATLKWSAPKDTGNCPITNYVVEYRASGSYQWTVANPRSSVTQTEFTVTGLSEGTEYEFRVTAENKVGRGATSEVSAAVKFEESVAFVRQLENQKITKILDTVTFECELSQEGATVDWMKGDKTLKKGDKYDIIVRGAVHRLVVKEAEGKDAGDYSVVFKKKTSKATLTVEAPPTILKTDEKYKAGLTLYAGKSTLIEVPFSGHPQPNITWQFNGGRLPDPSRIKEETAPNSTSLSLSKVKRSDAGTYSVALENSHGRAMWAVKIKVIDKPDPCTNYTSKNITANGLTLTWSTPLSDGGADITGYVVEKKEGNRRMWQSVGTTEMTEFEVSGLYEGNQYNFRVMAENCVGQSEPVELKDMVTAKSQFSIPSPPGAPTVSDVRATSCVLRWSPPVKDGGTPITGYIVERSTGTRWIQLKARPTTCDLEVTDLYEDEKYDFRVIAENKEGQSKPSEPSGTIVAKNPWKLPGPPGIPTIEAIHNTAMQLKWTPPTDDGGCEPEGYVLEYRVEGTSSWQAASTDSIPDLEYTVRRLKTDLAYEFRVAAKNKAGVGKFSSITKPAKASSPIVGDPPEVIRPLKEQTAVSPKPVTLECSINLGDPLAKVKFYKDTKEVFSSGKYDIEIDGNKVKLHISGTELSDAGRYCCEAVNKLGQAKTEAKLIVQAAPKVSLDTKFQTLQKIRAGTTMKLQANVAGVPAPTATWFFEDSPVEKTAIATTETTKDVLSLTITSPTKVNTGKYRVVAENSVGSDSAEIVVTILDTPPAPQNVDVVEKGKDFIILSWKPPQSDGGSPIIGYVLEKREATRSSWSKVGSTSSETLKHKAMNLTEGTDYVFRVAAENSIGVGEFATLGEAAKAALPFGVPKAPRNLQVEDVSIYSVTLTWEPPSSDGGGAIIGYLIEKCDAFGSRWIACNRAPVTAPTYVLRDLPEGAEYQFRVIAVNDAGEGPPSDSTGVVCVKDAFSKPDKPGDLSVTISEKGTAELKWIRPKEDGNSPVKSYLLEMKPISETKWKVIHSKALGTSYTVEGLTPDTEYEFRVSAENKIGMSEPLISKPIKYDESISFTKELSDVKVTKLPSTIDLECELSKSNMPVTWYKDDRPIKSSAKYEIDARGRSHRLTIKGIDAEDEGVYKATTKNIKTTAKVAVQAAPEFIIAE